MIFNKIKFKKINLKKYNLNKSYYYYKLNILLTQKNISRKSYL